MEVSRTTAGISLCQRKYALKVLSSFGLLAFKPSTVPIEPNLKLSKADVELLNDPKMYRNLVGRLMYLTITKPNITFAVNKLCQYSSALRISHLKAVYKVLSSSKAQLVKAYFTLDILT